MADELDTLVPKRSLATFGLWVGFILILGAFLAFMIQRDNQIDEKVKNETTQSQFVSSDHRVDVERVLGKELKPDSVSIVCVDGSAFLYVDRDVAYRGNAIITRFAEKDASCPKEGKTP